MNLAIKILEEIGQNTSIKQHDDLIEMLGSMNLKEDSIENIGLKTHDFVCMLFPKDPDKKDDKKDDQKDDKKDDDDKKNANE